ncbi:CBU_0592 family membrane protein [Pseudemcibacter aquimaris]|uniref:CBU_0592 family membrane protein n=1 Tax=Pseudemcibacter aquimaris TaxID=2857064 RepID=UPI0020137422|nr:hypothetical protein [Pseudemcibacter aquimaris]MCC3859744.1 hypothetical protein [Pseudemcibacter aquimaris]WDU60138.1 hypothetical protein KW060_07690 [Pseudemcibacter aquimaris]
MNEVPFYIDIIGWAGAATLLIAYFFLSNGTFKSNSYIYQGLNASASVCLIINTYSYGTIPLVVLNTTWLLIGLNSIRKLAMAPSK